MQTNHTPPSTFADFGLPVVGGPHDGERRRAWAPGVNYQEGDVIQVDGVVYTIAWWPLWDEDGLLCGAEKTLVYPGVTVPTATIRRSR